jgi:hypothetical protein
MLYKYPIISLLATLIAPAIATATMVPRLDLQQMVQSSESIVQARIVRHWSAWDPSHRFIWTHYEMEVQDRLKGGAATTVISEPGGLVDGTAMKVEGVPEHRDGEEEEVVFLHRTPVGYWRCYGLVQGKFTVDQTRSRPKRVRANLTAVERVQPARGRGPRARTSTKLDDLNGITLADLKARIRREAALQ